MIDSDGDSMAATLDTVTATLSTLQTTVEEQIKQTTEQFRQVGLQFTQVDQQFKQVDQQFTQVDRRFAQVDQRFAQVDQRFAQVDQRFAQVDQRFTQVEALIRFEGERTRRHFDVVFERTDAERNAVLDLGLASLAKVTAISAANSAEREVVEQTLADHEVRLRQLEQKTNPAVIPCGPVDRLSRRPGHRNGLFKDVWAARPHEPEHPSAHGAPAPKAQGRMPKAVSTQNPLTTGSTIALGFAAEWWIVCCATRGCVPLPSGSPVFRLRSNCGKLLDVMSTRIRCPGWNTIAVPTMSTE